MPSTRSSPFHRLLRLSRLAERAWAPLARDPEAYPATPLGQQRYATFERRMDKLALASPAHARELALTHHAARAARAARREDASDDASPIPRDLRVFPVLPSTFGGPEPEPFELSPQTATSPQLRLGHLPALTGILDDNGQWRNT